MALRAKKPEAIDRRLKLLLYGAPGAGKTTAAIQFPQPYLIDTEAGAQNSDYVGLLDAAGGAYMGPEEGATNLDAILAEVRALRAEKHPYRTLIIDPITVPYHALVDQQADVVGTEFGRNKQVPDRKMRNLLTQCMSLDMTVIFTAHAKRKYERTTNARGKEEVTQVGYEADAYKRLSYTFDFAFEVRRDKDKHTALISKSRDRRLPVDTVIPFSYEELAKRVGHEVLDREAQATELADEALVESVLGAIAARSWPEKAKFKGKHVGWRACLDKYGAEVWSDVPAEGAAKFLAFIRDTNPAQLEEKEAAA